ncbi:hypothetical protein Mal15_25870 [Stieleria maiorica]|uniref:Uncharacterized protein n=1 Tax=Stieleria maiorica TaxID=2795974 RepID=A0A5B9MG07_9BACT|nr:hypothetical protein [Stieleria maiorica]QEF98535.1 hypothetical protein Mal15_25870 [Stieleria maiorica]
MKKLMLLTVFLFCCTFGCSPNEPEMPQFVRDYERAILESDLGPLDKVLTSSLCNDRYALDSGLIQTIAGTIALRQVVWHDVYVTTSGTRQMFLLDCFIRPVASTPIQPVAVITDADFKLINWRLLSPWSEGFQAAELAVNDDGTHTLTVRTLANWFAGTISYPYPIRDDQFIDEGQVYTGPKDDSVVYKGYNGDPPNAKDALKALRATRQDEDGVFVSPILNQYSKHGLGDSWSRGFVHDDRPRNLRTDKNVEPKRYTNKPTEQTIAAEPK